MNGDRAASPSPSCRKLLRSAQRSFPIRQHALVQRYLVDLRDNDLDFSRRTAKASARRVAAGLTALREEQRHTAAFPDGPALYQPSVPADFARRMAQRVGAATLDLRVERWLLLACCALLAIAVPVAFALYGGSGVEVAAAVFPSLSQAAPGWLLAVAACVALNGLMEPLRRRFAAR